MAKNVSVMATLAAVKRGFLKKRMSSIGWSVRSSQATKAPSSTRTGDERAERPGPTVQPLAGASMIAQSRATRPTMDSTAPARSSLGAVGSFEVGTRKRPADEGEDHDRHVHQEHRAPREVLEQEAADQRAEGDADAGDSRPRWRWPGPAPAGREDVGEERQRGRHDQRAADAHEGPGGDQHVGARRRWPRRASRRRRCTRPT